MDTKTMSTIRVLNSNKEKSILFDKVVWFLNMITRVDSVIHNDGRTVHVEIGECVMITGLQLASGGPAAECLQVYQHELTQLVGDTVDTLPQGVDDSLD